jgi:hypothetical protein
VRLAHRPAMRAQVGGLFQQGWGIVDDWRSNVA